MFKAAVCIVLVCVSVGCASRSDRIKAPGSVMPQPDGTTPTASLEEFMSKVRTRSQMARPVSSYQQTAEAGDHELAAALLAVRTRPSAATHRSAAAHYLRLGITDVAHEHFTAATKYDSEDAASWDGLARIWRDWGFPALALPDATRAVYFAPRSAIVHNTLGTVLQSLGRRAEAVDQYQKALEIDPGADYALSNLCYGWVLVGQGAKATEACRQALQLNPKLEAARNNLAVAHEVNGDFTAAREVLASSSDAARAEYNAGILHLASRRYAEALKSFDKALELRPPFRAAELMARQTRTYLREGNQ